MALAALVLTTACSTGGNQGIESEILQWKDGKKAAVSLTYDDGSINQFRVALPIMEEMGFRGTFFINTGQIPGSQYRSRFIGRPVEEIIAETATIPTTPDNLFERGSAVGFLGIPGLMDAHTRAGAAVDAGNMERACRIIDEAYAVAREKVAMKKAARIEAESGNAFSDDGAGGNDYAGPEQITWEEIGEFAARGHEFASHTISHPRLAILDEPNMRWELEKCKEEIAARLGTEHTFSCECPYGTENERVMEIALSLYPALRNRMPHPWLEELNRSSRAAPGDSERAYVQWQRGPLSRTPLSLMESWIDTCLSHDNIWLVLVFHGVDGIGWEAIPGDTLHHYFGKLHTHGEDLWVAPFRDVTRYMRERMNGKAETTMRRKEILVSITHSLDPERYAFPLTVRTRLPEDWERVRVTQDGKELAHLEGSDSGGGFITFEAQPNQDPVRIVPLR